MSYEGYYQVLCKNGHQDHVDVYDSKPTKFFSSEKYKESDKLWECPYCGSEAIWSNSVDTTNGSFEYYSNGKYIHQNDYDDTFDYFAVCEKGIEVRVDGYIELEVIDGKFPQRYKVPDEDEDDA